MPRPLKYSSVLIRRSPPAAEETERQQDQDDGGDGDLQQRQQDEQVTRFEEGEGAAAVKPDQLRDAPPAEELGEVGAVVGGGADVEGVIGDEARPRRGEELVQGEEEALVLQGVEPHPLLRPQVGKEGGIEAEPPAEAPDILRRRRRSARLFFARIVIVPQPRTAAR